MLCGGIPLGLHIKRVVEFCMRGKGYILFCYKKANKRVLKAL